VKTCIATIAFLSLAGLIWADDLDDGFNNLKAAVEAKKGPDDIKGLAATTLKAAKAVAAAPAPADVEPDSWKKRQEFAAQVASYTEYALAITAAQSTDAAKTVELVDALIAENPKSTYLDQCASAYMAALYKQGGAAKQLDGAAKIVAARPDNEFALITLAEGSLGRSPDRALGYANKLLTLSRKPKPEGVADADWERLKSAMQGTGYYVSGVVSGQKQGWIDCDRDLKAAVPFINKDNNKLAFAYFQLGVCNYQLGKLTADRTRIQAGQKFSAQAAAMPGPMQGQAAQNAAAMQRELGGPPIPAKAK
jgi:hypothetical protein